MKNTKIIPLLTLIAILFLLSGCVEEDDSSPESTNTSSCLNVTMSNPSPALTSKTLSNKSSSFSEYIDPSAINRSVSTSCTDFSHSTPPGGAEQQPLLVVRIAFEGDNTADIASYPYSEFTSDACIWAKKFFYNDSEGQLNHYFNEVSYDKFHVTPAFETHNNDSTYDGIITVRLPGVHPDPKSGGSFHQKLVDALADANAYIDFSSFDVSSDGIIHRTDLQIMFLVAGYESATTLDSSSYPGVWAHQWCLDAGTSEGINAPSFDGVTVLACNGNGYTRFGESHTSQGYDATIGIIAHELGHGIWGLPDLYDTNSANGASAGIGLFGLMGSGSWGYDASDDFQGQTPVHPTAWTKMVLNWLTAELPASGVTHTMNSSDRSDYNIVMLPITSDEFFLIENRGSSGYDKGLYSLYDVPLGGQFEGGIAIWHVDHTQNSNDDETHKIVDLEEAANNGLDAYNHQGSTKNVYYHANNCVFNDSSSPNSKDYSNNSTDISVTVYSERGSKMYISAEHP